DEATEVPKWYPSKSPERANPDYELKIPTAGSCPQRWEACSFLADSGTFIFSCSNGVPLRRPPMLCHSSAISFPENRALLEISSQVHRSRASAASSPNLP